jgi:predicted TIM-barrel fold metal-dependent hydrolase
MENGSDAPVERSQRIEWVDVHAHLVGRSGRDYEEAARAYLRVMKEEGLRRVVFMPPPRIYDNRPLDDYEGFLPAVKDRPERFAFLGGGGSLNPMLQAAGASAEIGAELKRQFEAKAMEILRQGALGFGEIAAHHLSQLPEHPYESVPADHPLLLLLADIAARNGVVIDLHFDVVAEDTNAPAWMVSPLNPRFFRANLDAFERLLRHNSKAKIVWAHAGSDMFGYWTTDLSRRLLQKYSNLYMSLRMAPGRAPQNHPLTRDGEIKPAWLRLLNDFPDRFVIGGDQFIVPPAIRGEGPALSFSRRAPITRAETRKFLEALPPDLARKIAYENAILLYSLKER